MMVTKIEAGEMADRWCILRTTGPRTIALAKSLADAGFGAWTPAQTITRRSTRSRERISRDIPIAPTFVFAQARHLPDLADICTSPMSPHPAFSIFRFAGRIPLVDGREMVGMHAEEDRGKLQIAKVRSRLFEVGQRVRVTSGIACGLTGVVVKPGSKFPMINIGAGMPMKIAAWILEADEVRGENSQGATAIAAVS